MIEVRVTLKDGEVWELNPVLNITIDNGSYEYDYKPEEIESIKIYDVENDRDSREKEK